MIEARVAARWNAIVDFARRSSALENKANFLAKAAANEVSISLRQY
jgi:hypothetical protein